MKFRKETHPFLYFCDSPKHRLGFLLVCLSIAIFLLLYAITQSTLQAQTLSDTQQTTISSTIAQSVLPPGQHSLKIVLKNSAGVMQAQQDVLFSVANQPVAQEICIQARLKNRIREAHNQNYSVPITVEIKNASTTLFIYAAQADTSGKIIIADPSLTSQIQANGQYDIVIKPKGHKLLTIVNQQNLFSGCKKSSSLHAVGDFNNDGIISAADVIRAIVAYLGGTDVEVAEAYGNEKPTKRALIDLVRELNGNEQPMSQSLINSIKK